MDLVRTFLKLAWIVLYFYFIASPYLGTQISIPVYVSKIFKAVLFNVCCVHVYISITILKELFEIDPEQKFNHLLNNHYVIHHFLHYSKCKINKNLKY